MINFRFHIISLTAVFLALGIGIAAGTTFIDDATVARLEDNLDGLEARLNDTLAHNDELSRQVSDLRSQATELGQEASARLLDGHLPAVPVIVVADRGVDGDAMDGTLQALGAAGADVWGTLWATERLSLEDDDARADLAGIVRIISDDPDRIRRLLVLELADVLADPLRPVPPAAEPDGQPVSTTTAPIEPDPLVAELVAGGFLDYEPGPRGDDEPVLPAGDARLLAVSGTGAVVPPAAFLGPLLAELAEAGPVPVVAAAVVTGTGEDADAERDAFVGPLREGDVAERLSTVDDLEGFGGWAAAVLALEDAAEDRFGHYGVGDGADRLLPVAPGPEG
jgi:Copper transport outer membrane protein, MctB